MSKLFCNRTFNNKLMVGRPIFDFLNKREYKSIPYSVQLFFKHSSNNHGTLYVNEYNLFNTVSSLYDFTHYKHNNGKGVLLLKKNNTPFADVEYTIVRKPTRKFMLAGISFNNKQDIWYYNPKQS